MLLVRQSPGPLPERVREREKERGCGGRRGKRGGGRVCTQSLCTTQSMSTTSSMSNSLASTHTTQTLTTPPSRSGAFSPETETRNRSFLSLQAFIPRPESLLFNLTNIVSSSFASLSLSPPPPLSPCDKMLLQRQFPSLPSLSLKVGRRATLYTLSRFVINKANNLFPTLSYSTLTLQS